MLTIKELLMETEVFIGDYHIEIARWSDNQWQPTVPPLYAILTDLRFIFQRQALKKLAPAIIPNHYIIHIKPFQSQIRHGVILTLRNDQRIAFFIPTHQRQEIMRNLRTVAINAIRGEKRYDMPFDVSSLEKMIDHIKKI